MIKCDKNGQQKHVITRDWTMSSNFTTHSRLNGLGDLYDH